VPIRWPWVKASNPQSKSTEILLLSHRSKAKNVLGQSKISSLTDFDHGRRSPYSAYLGDTPGIMLNVLLMDNDTQSSQLDITLSDASTVVEHQSGAGRDNLCYICDSGEESQVYMQYHYYVILYG